jgi:apolipoprotein D and lipocalin family protein
MNKKLLYAFGITGLATLGYVFWKKKSKNIFNDLPVVDNFDVQRYIGKWYEIARFHFKHEEGLTHTVAHYSFNEDNSIKVVNKGFDPLTKEWNEAIGKAQFVDYDFEGRLKVSFFGPFYDAYNIMSIDDDYHYALVFGKDTNYLWFLSREITIPKKILKKYMKIAQMFGYDLTKLVWVDQE